MLFRALLLGVSLLAMSQPASAAPPVCNSTSEGTIVYNKAHLTMQFCNGANWIAMSGNFGGGGGADNLGDHIATQNIVSDTHNTDDLGTTAIRWKDGWFAGTVTAGTFAGSGASLTALNATNLGSGTVPDARFPATLPAVSGENLTNLDASDLATGTVPTARLGSGTANSTTYLRGDGTWAAPSVASSIWKDDGPGGPAEVYYNGGNVGIGTNDPTAKLDVQGAGAAIRALGGGASNLASFQLGRSATDGTLGVSTTAGNWASNSVAGDIILRTETTGQKLLLTNGSAAAAMAINNGSVGIGTITPSTKLEVSGTATATLFAGSGASLTNLNATNLASGTVATARLGTGTANNTTYLRGDGTWQTVPAGADNLGNHIATQNIVSDTHNTDDLGTTAIRWKDGWFAGTVTGGTFAGSGASLTALNASNLASGTIPDARLTGNYSGLGTVTATSFAGSGASLTALNASQLTTGTVATARLGTGTANSSVFLRGDGTWAALAGDNLGAGGTTVGTLYSSNASGYGYIGSEGGATGAYMRFDGSPAASAGNIYVNLLGTWEYRFNAGYFGPYATNVNDLGSSTVKWSDGFFAGNVSAAAYLHTSDERMKKDIVDIDDPLALINGLRGVHYKWKENDKPAYGLIAQEVEKVVPDAVDTDDQGMKSVEYDQIIGPLVEAVKAQQKQIEALQAEVQALKSKGAE